MGSLSLLQQIFLTQELNWGLLHCRGILYQLSYQETIASNIMQDAGLDEAQAGIKISGRNINNHKYVPPLWQKVKRS